ncbi:MAG: hypothetical protein HY278_00580 [candidate division NC10 bacterium]|nr:hypothetical protein [candidate division NC10 bacterium]
MRSMDSPQLGPRLVVKALFQLWLGLVLILLFVGCTAYIAYAAEAEGPQQVPKGVNLFVSSIIPEASLNVLAQDAAPLRVPLLLRGLVGTSLQETLARMQSVVKVGAALEIDPLPFEAYGIEQVPAVVLTCGTRGEGPFAVVYGLTVSKALPILRRMLPCPHDG